MEIDSIAQHDEHAGHVGGVCNSAISSNFSSIYVVLKSFHDREGPEQYSEMITTIAAPLL